MILFTISKKPIAIIMTLCLLTSAWVSAQDDINAPQADNCFVEYTGDNITDTSSADHTALQTALDLASAGTTIKIAGVCKGATLFNVIAGNVTLVINKDITLQGGYDSGNLDWLTTPDPTTYPTILDADSDGTVVYVLNDLTVSMDGLTIQNGNNGGLFNTNADVTLTHSHVLNNTAPSGVGGGVFNAGGDMTIRNSLISGNSSPSGGGVRSGSQGTLIISDTTISDNQSGTHGGAVYNNSTTFITRTTMTGNSASNYGGAVYAGSRPIVISNSTLANNNAIAEGGAIRASGAAVTLVNVSLVNNQAVIGANLRYSSGSLTLYNTIVTKLPGTSANCDGNITDGGYNISSDASCNFNATGSLNTTDPRLDTTGLQDNGGPTQTIALRLNSPAINAGNNNVISEATTNLDYNGDGDKNDQIDYDQRNTGYPRIINTTVDIGAFESPHPYISADLDNDGFVTPADVIYIINRIGSTDALADLDNSGLVDVNDALIALDQLGDTA